MFWVENLLPEASSFSLIVSLQKALIHHLGLYGLLLCFVCIVI